MTQSNTLKLFKATITDADGEKQEVPVWALDLEKALDSAEVAYGEVDRVRPVFSTNEYGVQVTK